MSTRMRRSPAGRGARSLPASLAAALAIAATPALVLHPAAGRAAPAAAGGAADALRGPDSSPPPWRSLSSSGEGVRVLVGRVEALRAESQAPGLRDEERDALLERAWALVDEALADPALRDAALREPGFLRARALLLMDDGEDEEALGELGRLRSIAAADPETHYLTGLCLMGLDRPAEAAVAYQLALEHGIAAPAEARARRAFALAAAGRSEEGLAESGRALAEDPREYFGHYVRGWILEGLGRRAEARAAYVEAVRLERNDADLWALLAQSWEREGDRREALAAWREVQRIDPSDEDAAARVRLLGP